MIHGVRQFFVSLALDPAKMAEYLKNSDTVLDMSTLTEQEKVLITSRNHEHISNALSVVLLEPDEEPQPAPAEEPETTPEPEPADE